MNNLDKHFEQVQSDIGYSFRNPDLLYQAFTRSSYSAQYGTENNEVLEFIGDRVIDFYVVKIIADRFGFFKSDSDYYDEDEDMDEFCIVANKDEADFTAIKQQIVSNKNLAANIDELNFARYLYLGDSDVDNHVEQQTKVKADLLEAIIGAIAIDCEWNPAIIEQAVSNLLQIDDYLDDVDVEEERPDKFKIENAVTTLKELAEQGKCSRPEYEISDEPEYIDGQQWWKCICTVRSWGIIKSGYATSKKEAKRYAAYLVLCTHYDLPNEFEN